MEEEIKDSSQRFTDKQIFEEILKDHEIEKKSSLEEDSSQENEDLHSQFQQKEEEREDVEKKYLELKNEYLKVFADFENTKKRLEREKGQALEYAYEKFAKDLLPILDSLIAAKESVGSLSDGNGVHEGIIQGIDLVLENFLKVLSKYGISEIQTDGDFDPNVHDGILQVRDENLPEGKIARVMQKGYVYKERILRPALVAIVKNQ